MVTKSALVRECVTKVESLVPRYPKHFYSTEEAKHYIKRVCEASAYNYGLHGDAPYFAKRHVIDKVHFIVALRAYQDGEFHLDIPPAQPGELRRKCPILLLADCN
tara:strand:+ start:21722 stop:22036 length:315 start_codon:yes stop_codon:yes gene_type:complete